MHPIGWRLIGVLLACAAGTAPAQAATYRLNDFTVVNNGSTAFSDSFDDGFEPIAPTYGVSSTFASDAESDGQLRLSASLGVPFGTGKVIYAGPNQSFNGTTFSFTGRFDYTTPEPGEVYFVRLDDIALGAPPFGISVHSYSVAVTASGGQTFATLSELSPAGAVHELFSSGPLAAAGHDQIALSFFQGQDGQVHGAYQLVGGSGGDGALQDLGTLSPAVNHLFYGTAFGSYAAPVPEPGTALSMLLGLGALGVAARRQRRAPR